jgi:hypothetical protein
VTERGEGGEPQADGKANAGQTGERTQKPFHERLSFGGIKLVKMKVGRADRLKRINQSRIAFQRGGTTSSTLYPAQNAESTLARTNRHRRARTGAPARTNCHGAVVPLPRFAVILSVRSRAILAAHG